ncbi:MAG TPA: hypothetical protein VGR93_00810 [Candidatus Acidoferrales bacterium]|nr:hypothetical protein [Candidatus Acidoferrales bacterium]
MNSARDKKLSPKDALIDGARILGGLLFKKGFEVRFRGAGKSSGGDFAWGEFFRADRRLELHFRASLGLVRYHVGDQSASHEFYMRELGVLDQCRYPTFSNDPMSAFEGLLHDLGFADDFLDGSAEKLREAAAKEEVVESDRQEDAMAGNVGDKRRIEQLHKCFHDKEYREVVNLARALKYPNRLSESERKMVEIAQTRAGANAAGK